MQQAANENLVESDKYMVDDDAMPRTFLPWAIWLIATGFVLFQFQLQLCSGPMVDKLMTTFSITAFGAGILSSTYYYVYVIMQIPAGILIDRYGARSLLSSGALVCTVGCFMFAYSQHLLVAELGRVLMGGGSSFAFVGALFLVDRWFPKKRFAFLIGMCDMLGAVFSMAGNVAIAAATHRFDWRDSMLVAGGMAFLLAILSYFIIRDNPPGKAIAHQKIDLLTFKTQVKKLLSDEQLWLHGIYIGILFAVVCVFSGLWGIPFIQVQKQIGITQSTFIASIAFVGLGVCCPIMGWLFPYISRPRVMLSFCASMAAIVTTVLIYWPVKSIYVYSGLMFVMGMTVSVYVFNFGMVQKIIQEEIRSTAMGFLNTLCVITVPIFQPLVGYILHHDSTHTIVNGTEVYTLANYHHALSVIPISLAIAALIPLFLRFEKD